MTRLIVVAGILLLLQEKNPAEELFKKMEEKIAKAGTLEAAFTTTFEQKRGGEEVTGDFKGTILLESGNRARLEFDGKIVEPMKTCIISDGRMTVQAGEDPKIYPPSAATPRLSRDARVHLARNGGMAAVMEAQRELSLDEGDRRIKEAGGTAEPRETDIHKTMRLRDFKSGPREKINGREAEAVHYVADDLKRKGESQITVWIDPKSHLPIRRRISDTKKGILIEEVFTEFKLDEKIDPGKFELPKEAQ